MQADHGPGLGAGPDDRLPVAVEDGRHAEAVGALGQGHRREAPLGVAADLLGTDLGVGEPGDAHGDDALGMRRPPLLEEPVVPRLRRRQTELGVGALREHPPAEAGDHRGEVERRPHAVDVHVADAGLDVVAAGPHLIEAEGLDLHRLRPPAGDGVHADLAVDLAVELPDLVPPLVDHDPGRLVLQLLRQATLEHVGRLDQVVVDADDGVPDLPGLRLGEEQVLVNRARHASILIDKQG